MASLWCRGPGESADEHLIGLGAWMNHGSFTVQIERLREDDVTINGRYGLAGGDLTGTRPAGGATWLGLMVGTPATGTHRGDRLLGDSALNFDLNSDTLDVAFSSIKNIDRNAAHSTQTVMFQNLQISSGGRSKPAWPATVSRAASTVPVTLRRRAYSSSRISSARSVPSASRRISPPRNPRCTGGQPRRAAGS